jgi:hypothetical protein
MKNPVYVAWVQDELNSRLRVRGYVSANEALKLLGFACTVEGGQAGWIRDHEGEGDGYIDLGIWVHGFLWGRDWLQGKIDAMPLYFNVDRTIVSMPRRIKKLKEEGKIL